MNSKNLHRHVIRLIASTFLRLLRPVKFLSSHDVVPGHFEQRNINGYVMRVWVPTHRHGSLGSAGQGAPAAQAEHPGLSRGPGAEVNYAAAEYIASLRLEPSHLETDTSVACV